MKRVLHPGLMRGHIAERAAVLLLVALLTILAAAVLHGMRALPC